MGKLGSFRELIWPILCMLGVAVLLFVERSGITQEVSAETMQFLPQEVLIQEKSIPEKRYLLLVDSGYFGYSGDITEAEFVLNSMCIGYDLVDVAIDDLPDVNKYENILIMVPDLMKIGEEIFSICDWVYDGGNVAFLVAPYSSAALDAISSKFGVINTSLGYTDVTGMKIETDIMPGSRDKIFNDEVINGSALLVQLDSKCKIHMRSTDQKSTPLLWERPYGEGKFVFNNSDILLEKVSRGLLTAVYTLLEDVFAYPVINASMFFIDDFPSPVPQGVDERIMDQYGYDISGFYTNVWWPDMVRLSEKYGLKYTGLVVETYNDTVVPPFEDNLDVERYRYFGGMLLNMGGELGLHGYNHMSLVLEDFDYMGKVNYIKWRSTEDMASAMKNLLNFSESLFPDNKFMTYVPPSNILSEDGYQMIVKNFPQIKIISGVYHNENYEYVQEFDIDKYGIFNLPRIISGCLNDNYDHWAAINEVMFHYVNSHFLHPDDVLDDNRGGKEGWNYLIKSFEKYLKGLYTSAPGLRNMTSQQAAKALQRYDNLMVNQELRDKKLYLNLEGFYDEAYLILSVEDGTPGLIQGGSVEHICGNLYLLHATSNEVIVMIEE